MRNSALLVSLLVVIIATGCRPGASQAPPPAATVIPVSHPMTREVTEFVEYTGRTDAVESVGIRARVTGYLMRAPFKEGAEVKKGDVLFEIDARPYQAQLDQALGQVRVAEAQSELAKTNYTRIKMTGIGASAQEVDQAKATMDAAEAQVKAAKATAEVYRLNLEYTKVLSPIDGQVSRSYFAVGNLVSQDQTLLTTVVSTDPMQAYFDMDERTMLRVRKLINLGRIEPRSEGNSLPVQIGLEGEEGFPHAGTIDFVNNVVNPSTGTIAVRGVFANEKPKDGRRLLTPGMFVRFRMPIGKPHPAVLVVDRAIGSDQGLKYVYVVDAQKKVSYRRVQTGPLEDDGLRVIESGLSPEELVAVGAIQQLRPGMEAEIEVVAMPVPGATAQASPPPAVPVKKKP
ncbi:multidrug efflux RND transporter periplasmic adaptor subunit MexE [soil metagenome]